MSITTTHPLRRDLAACAVFTVVFLLLDACWLSLMNARLYRPAIGHLMRPDFLVPAAAAFYALYVVAVGVFVLRPAARAREALVRGAFFGFVCYATYDLTNQATLVGWPWQLTVVDLIWGAFATGLSAGVAWRVVRGRRG